MGREELRGVLHRLPATTRLPEVGGVGERFMICGCLPRTRGVVSVEEGLLHLFPPGSVLCQCAMCLSGSLKELYCPGCLR